jgi:HSP20 family molecular chaperone IbpA
MAPERKVPVLRTDFSVLDTEFDSIRERFEQEMKKMEEEMSKFRSELLAREQNFLHSSTSSSSTEKQVSSGGTPFKTWLDGIESPLIQEGGDGKQLKLRFDVSQYVPEEIVVKTVDNKLMVHAKHEEKSENRSVYREYNREFLLPKGTNPEAIKSSLSKDGILTVEAPLPAIDGPREHMITIK